MGKPRSGRKAWRGIDASAVEDAHATAALRAKSGADVATLPDDALFFVDASAAPGARTAPYAAAAAAAVARTPLRRALRTAALRHACSRVRARDVSR